VRGVKILCYLYAAKVCLLYQINLGMGCVMGNKSLDDSKLKRVSVGLPLSIWQKIDEIAEDEVRPQAVQASYFVKLGLIAHNNGYRIKNGNLKRFEPAEAE